MATVLSKFFEKFSNVLEVNKANLNVMTIVIPENSIFLDLYTILKESVEYIPNACVAFTGLSMMYSGFSYLRNKRLLYQFDQVLVENQYLKHKYIQDLSDIESEYSDEDSVSEEDEEDDLVGELDNDYLIKKENIN